jgi:Calcineurin-like phosphoesterase
MLHMKTSRQFAFLAARFLGPLLVAVTVLGSAAAQVPSSFHFTVTSDIHQKTAIYGGVLDAMLANSGGQGAFQISIGDVCDRAGQTPQTIRDLIDSRCGAQAVWYPAVGNHDASVATTSASMTWRYAEYETGNGVRTPLKKLVSRPGPAGCVATTYSWDLGNAHFVVLNEYWNGGTAAGSDVATKGDIVPALRKWLEADLAANTKPLVFVFGHEPAFPQHRHAGNSLDNNAANRDAFWDLLRQYRVQAFISGHIHYYYKDLRQGVWQISDGNAGNSSGEKHQTYLDVIVGQTQAEIKVWQNDADGSTAWHLADTITVNAAAIPAQGTKASAPVVSK